MRGKHNNHAKASQQHRWKPGGSVASNGYVKLRVGKGHPLADRNGYAYEHLVVWCAAGNPRPERGYLIHHRNEDKTDNRIENLELMSRREHSQEHSGAIPDEWVVTIRKTYADGTMTMKELAVHFETSVQRVSKIVRGEVRKSAGGPITVGKKRAGRLLDGVLHDGMPGRDSE